VSEKTIYRRIKSGQLVAKLEGQPTNPHWVIELVDVGRPQAGQRSGQGEDAGSFVIELLREQLQEKDRQIAELHVLIREGQEQLRRLLPAPMNQQEPHEPKKRRWWWPF
jgi:hypothetical protein